MPTRVDVDGVKLGRRVFVEIGGFLPVSWQEVDRLYVRPLRSYLQACVLAECAVTDVAVQAGGKWMSLLARNIGQAQTPKASEVVLQLPDVGIGSLGEWLDCVDDSGPAPAVVSDSFADRSRSLETQLLELATVAEGLHRMIFPQRDRLDAVVAARVKTLVRDAIAAESDQLRNIVNSRFSYIEEMSYPHRLRDLALEAEHAIPGIAGRVNKWTAEVTGARNSFAHGKKVDFDDKAVDTLLGVVESLRWVLLIVLLLNSGIPINVLRERIGEGQAYERFRSEAAILLPAVYRS